MARFRPHLLCLGLVALVVTGLFSGNLTAAELVSHRATYSLQLDQANPTGRYSAVKGGATTSLERTCEGWISAEDVGMVVSTRIGGEIAQHLRFTGWESANGLKYQFVSRSRFGAERLNVKGRASLEAAGTNGTAIYQLPVEATRRLPAGTRFPTGHLAWLINRARADYRQSESFVFDGSDDQGPERMVVFVGSAFEQWGDGSVPLGPLTDRPGWLMRFAAFGEESMQAQPDYEFEAKLLDNGVIVEVLLDFQEFTVMQSLVKIEPSPESAC